jgi:hypothetical protein
VGSIPIPATKNTHMIKAILNILFLLFGFVVGFLILWLFEIAKQKIERKESDRAINILNSLKNNPSNSLVDERREAQNQILNSAIKLLKK